ncbi:alpha/beta fold hydrolase [Heyndrickxia sp. NPDC080065]|uniref:alpha/beta fold hydrolase n=1 Tax=Heyndrickxia sp. NPDC080065 TaxID=3390568 RepID=UPI003CFF5C0A
MSITVSKLTKEISGIEIYFEEYKNQNANNTFVLLHGFLSSTFSFRRLIPLLNKDNNVVSIDIPPFGQSGKHPRYQYSYQNLAKMVINLISSLGYSSIYLIGHSMGGQISLNVMLQKPNLVKKGVLLCSSGYLNPSKRSLKLLSFLPFFHHCVKYYLEKSGVRKNVETVVFDRSIIDEEMLKGYEQPFLDKQIFRGLTRMIRDREGDLSVEQLHQITTPCLLIWGEHDRVVPLSIGKRLTKDLPHAQLIVLKDAGHLISEENAEEVFQHIDKFIHE